MSTTMDCPFPPLQRQASCRLEETAGVCLLEFLLRRFPYLAEDGWRNAIAEGRLKVDGSVVCTPDYRLPSEGILEFCPGMLAEPPVSWNIGILAESEDWLALNKPAPLPCHPAGHFFNHTLWTWLKQTRQWPSVHFLGRLDMETSGMVVATSSAATAVKLGRAIKASGHLKSYLVIVHGRWQGPSLARGWLIPDENAPVRKRRRFVQEQPPSGQETETAITEFALRGVSPDGAFSLLEATPVTGRMHQIRCTLWSLGYPVVGDKLYGLSSEFFLRQIDGSLTEADFARLLLRRQALHAWRLAWDWEGRHLVLEAPLPDEMLAFLRQHGLAESAERCC